MDSSWTNKRVFRADYLDKEDAFTSTIPSSGLHDTLSSQVRQKNFRVGDVKYSLNDNLSSSGLSDNINNFSNSGSADKGFDNDSSCSFLINQVSKRLKEAQKRILTAEHQRDSSMAEAAKLRKSLACIKNENKQTWPQETFDRNNVTLKNKIQEKKNELTKVKHELAITKSEYERVELEKEELNRLLIEERDRLDDGLSQEKLQFRKLKQQILDLQSKLDSEKTTTNRKLAEAYSKLDSETRRINDIATQVRHLNTQRMGLEKELTLAKNQKEQLNVFLVDARKAEEELRGNLAINETRVDRLKAEKERKEGEICTLSSKLSQLRSVLEGVENEREELERNLLLNQENNKLLEKELAELVEAKKLGESQLEVSRKEAEEAKKIARKVTERMNEAQTALKTEREIEVSKLEYENSILHMDVDRAQKELTEALQSHQEIQTQASNAK